MTTKAILEELEESYPEALTADGFDDAIVGVVERCSQATVVCYDYQKCVAILMKRDKMSREEAEEFLNFNTVGAWVGENTPAFLHYWRKNGLS